MIPRTLAGTALASLLTKLAYVVVTVILPLAVILANAAFKFGGILLTIALVVWMGFALVLLSPLLE